MARIFLFASSRRAFFFRIKIILLKKKLFELSADTDMFLSDRNTICVERSETHVRSTFKHHHTIVRDEQLP